MASAVRMPRPGVSLRLAPASTRPVCVNGWRTATPRRSMPVPNRKSWRWNRCSRALVSGAAKKPCVARCAHRARGKSSSSCPVPAAVPRRSITSGGGFKPRARGSTPSSSRAVPSRKGHGPSLAPRCSGRRATASPSGAAGRGPVVVAHPAQGQQRAGPLRPRRVLELLVQGNARRHQGDGAVLQQDGALAVARQGGPGQGAQLALGAKVHRRGVGRQFQRLPQPPAELLRGAAVLARGDVLAPAGQGVLDGLGVAQLDAADGLPRQQHEGGVLRVLPFAGFGVPLPVTVQVDERRAAGAVGPPWICGGRDGFPTGMLKISAGNYGGNGPFHLHLHKLLGT